MLSSPGSAVRRLSTATAILLAGAAWPVLAQTAPQSTPQQPQAPATNSPSQDFSPPPSDAPAPTSPAPAGAQATGTMQGSAPTAEPSGTNDQAADIVVTGYRRSLAESTRAKRNATAFTDSIFAEDIGKFPDTNLAESFNRIPGITISRDITGEGVNVAIRGLGSNFAQVTLNGAPISIASSGATDAQGTDRAVDLSLFPTDLFTKLTVNKSYTADLLEGGAAGNIDIRSARPFDRTGTHITYNFQGRKEGEADKWGERGSLIASTTMGNFGILVGVAGEHRETRTTGYETIGLTNPNLTTAQCGTGNTCNSAYGGNGFSIPGTVPSNAGNGLTPGATIDNAFLLAHNPGLTTQQLDNGLIPRLGRPSDEFGSRDRINAIASAEWRPSDSLHFYVDGMYGKRKNDLQRIDMDWVGRNGAAIPLNEKVDNSNCATGCVVTSGTFANSQFFLEYRPYIEHTEFYGVNPGAEWQITKNLKLDVQANYTHSTFHRESPSVVVTTPANSGDTVTFTNNAGGIPTISSSLDLNNPANFGWVGGGRVNIQDERRLNKTKGIRGDLTWGDDQLNVKVGGNYDDISRRISAFDNSQAYQNAVCGDNPNVFLASPNSQPPCEGLNVVGSAPAGYPTYPAYGTGATAGATGRVTYGGSLVPNAAVPQYLVPGPDGFVTLNWDKFAAATNYAAFHNAEPAVGAANTGASGGFIEEKSPAAFIEVNGVAHLGDNDLRFNAGVRYVHTDQTIGGLVSLPDPRNTVGTATCPATPAGATEGPLNGSCYPNVSNNVYTHSSYDKWLPAANVAFDIGQHAVARAAISRTMTRPDPTAQLPGVNFSSPSADTATIGNPALQPYLSTNIDLGFEYYTGQEGVISFAAFRKAITGFTQTGLTNVPFSALAQYGINSSTVTPTQLVALQSRANGGSIDNVSVLISQQVNAEGTLHVNGLEFQWVQPLDFLLGKIGIHGFGFNANATVVDQKGSGAAPAVATGVAPYTYNITGYYERHGISLRLSDVFNAGSQVSGSNQNSIPTAALFSDNYNEWDFSSIFDLEKMFGIRHAPQITFDVVNLTNSKLRTYFQFEDATFTEYKPGRQFLVGLRGSF
jgi:TonB-dependent receptor